MKKRIIAMLTAVVMLSALFSTAVLAAEDAGLQKAIETAKSKFDVPSDFEKFTNNIEKRDGKTIYYLTWNKEAKESYGGSASININIDNNGFINMYSKYDSNYFAQSEPYLPKNTKEQIKSKALEYIQNIDANVYAQLDMNSFEVHAGSVRDYSANISGYRMVNGVKYISNSVYVSMNKSTLDLTYYSANWNTSAVFPSTENTLSLEDAKTKFIENSAFELVYRPKDFDTKDNKTIDTMLAYIPTGTFYIDAVTGEKVESNASYSPYMEKEALARGGAMYDTASTPMPLTPQEAEEVERSAEFITEDKAESIARGIKEFEINSDYTLATISYEKSYAGHSQMLMRFEKKVAETKTDGTADILMDAKMIRPSNDNIYVSLDAKTGDVLSVFGNAYDYYVTEDKPAIDETQAQAMADAFVKKYAPNEAGSVKPEKASSNNYSPYMSFSYYQYHDGIKYVNNTIVVTVDPYKNKITSFTKNWNKNVNFAGKEGIIDIEKAYEAAFNTVGIHALYMDNPAAYYDSSANAEIKYVYSFKNVINAIDAKTGKVLNWDNSEFVNPDSANKSFTDIAGHYAENSINALVEAGIIAVDKEEFSPDSNITQEDFLRLVLNMVDYGYSPMEREQMYYLVKSRNIILPEEVNPESSVTRQDAVKFIIRALNLENVAKLDDIFTCSFNDKDAISSDMIGYIMLAKGLKIVSGDQNGNFNPSHNLSRAEAVTMLYNFLTRLD